MRAPLRAASTSRLIRFAQAERGASAIEFALVAIPFFLLLLGALELSLIFVSNASLQNATFSLARQIRVGELMAPGISQATSSGTQIDLADFKAKLCKSMPLTSGDNCLSHLYVDVRQLPNFTGSLPASPIGSNTLNTSSFCFYSGASGSVVEMRTFYTWQVFTPVLLNALINTKTVISPSKSSTGSWFTLSSQEVFRNEPGMSQSNTGASC